MDKVFKKYGEFRSTFAPGSLLDEVGKCILDKRHSQDPMLWKGKEFPRNHKKLCYWGIDNKNNMDDDNNNTNDNNRHIVIEVLFWTLYMSNHLTFTLTLFIGININPIL